MTSISESNSFAIPRAPSGQAGAVTAAKRHLAGRRSLYALAVVLLVPGLAFGGAWWGFAAILPLLYVLPCAAMIAMCMKGHGNGSGQNTETKPAPIPNLTGGSVAGEPGPR